MVSYSAGCTLAALNVLINSEQRNVSQVEQMRFGRDLAVMHAEVAIFAAEQ